jgi:hypothetical protein
LRIIEIVVRERPMCSANFLNVILSPESARDARWDAVDFIGSDYIRTQRIMPDSLALTSSVCMSLNRYDDEPVHYL